VSHNIASMVQIICAMQPVSFLARDIIYTSRAYATMSVSVCLWRKCIGALQLIYVSNSDPNLLRIVVVGRGHLNNNISCYASHC